MDDILVRCIDIPEDIEVPMTRNHGRRYEAVVTIDKIQPWLSFTRSSGSNENSDNNTDKERNAYVI